MSTAPLLPHRDLHWTPTINPESFKLSAQRLDELDKISLIRWRWNLCCSCFCCPIKCCVCCISDGKIIQQKSDFLRNIFAEPNFDYFTRRELSLLPPERQEMEVLEKNIDKLFVQAQLNPFTKAVNGNRGLFGITYGYLDPKELEEQIRRKRMEETNWHHSNMPVRQEIQERTTFRSPGHDVHIQYVCCNDSAPFFEDRDF